MTKLSRNKFNDSILARETQLIFNNTRGFRPEGTQLNRWRGEFTVTTSQGERSIPVEVLIPLKFPQYPPRVIVLDKNVHHPNIESDGNVLLRITHSWSPDTHVYQVILAAQDLFQKVPPTFGDRSRRQVDQQASVQSRSSTSSPSQRKVQDVQSSIKGLQREIESRDAELAELRAQLVESASERVTTVDSLEMLLPKDRSTRERLHLQAKHVALSDLLSTLDAKFKDGEISPVDFSKLYRRYTKELYLVYKQLDEV
ncbi:MAG: hypothetical protein GF308_16610 [Candidatus Heimdallarchaeota archaeon]|nr:hypothetical protein [Candidatus Heimdallarchaeota archaeon]